MSRTSRFESLSLRHNPHMFNSYRKLTYLLSAALVGGLLLMPGVSTAKKATQRTLSSLCSKDLKTHCKRVRGQGRQVLCLAKYHCKGVKSGKGRWLKCLSTKKTGLEPQCRPKVKRMLAARLIRLKFRRACRKEIRKHCRRVKRSRSGTGLNYKRRLKCLAKKDKKLGKRCRKSVRAGLESLKK